MHASRDKLPLEILGERYETRLAEWGDYTAYFERIPAGTDFGAYYDSCACPHWGYVFTGKVRFVHDDGREEVISAGEMYYVPADTHSTSWRMPRSSSSARPGRTGSTWRW